MFIFDDWIFIRDTNPSFDLMNYLSSLRGGLPKDVIIAVIVSIAHALVISLIVGIGLDQVLSCASP